MDHPSKIKSNRIPDYTRTLPRPHPCHRLERANASARGFYERVGFAESGTTSGGDVLVMRRRR